jgi:hypothetical protein
MKRHLKFPIAESQYNQKSFNQNRDSYHVSVAKSLKAKPDQF